VTAARPETIPARFLANARRLGARPAHHYNAGGDWYPVGWATAGEIVRTVARGLIELGHEQGDALAILSATRREWMYCDMANLAAGGVSVGVYPTLPPDQVRHILADAEARFCVVEDRAMFEAVRPSLGALPRLHTIVAIDPEGIELGSSDGPCHVLSLAELLERGRASRHDVDARVAAIRLEDAALFVYTSGTTGPPKGAMLTHGALTATLDAVEVIPLTEQDVGFSFLPLAHILQRIVDYRGLCAGLTGYYGRGIAHVADDLAHAAPTVMASVPRVFEKIYAGIIDQVKRGSPVKQRLFRWACEVGGQVSRLRRDGQPVPRALELQHAAAKRLVFGKLRARLGGRIRLFITGGAPIAAEILEFFHAAEINVLEGWGMTETCGAGTLNLPQPRAWRIGSIGRPVPGCELKLDDDGEILIRGPNLFSGYYKQEEATRSSFTSDGFFRTGDIGRVDDEGFFYIVDRKKDLIITAAGKNIAPQNVENHMKGDPRISQCVLIGDRRPYCTALIAVDEAFRNTADEAEIRRAVEEIVEARNATLAPYERIKKFRILPRDLTQEAGEITPTLKVKRRVVTERYGELIDEMYAEGKPRSPDQPRAKLA
jgi:long-chain acyl-CoA synthetase